MLKISGGEHCYLLRSRFFCEKCLEVSLRIEASFEWQEVRCKEHTSRHKAIKNRLLQRPDHTQTSKGRKFAARAQNRHTRELWFLLRSFYCATMHMMSWLRPIKSYYHQTSFPICFSKPKSSQEENQGLSQQPLDVVNSPFCVALLSCNVCNWKEIRWRMKLTP